MSSDARDALARAIRQSDPDMPPTRADWDDLNEQQRNVWRRPAGRILDALTAAGWVLLPPGEDRIGWYARRVRALERLLGFYRSGSRPPDVLHRELAETRRRINANGDWTPATPTDGSPTPTTTDGAQT